MRGTTCRQSPCDLAHRSLSLSRMICPGFGHFRSYPALWVAGFTGDGDMGKAASAFITIAGIGIGLAFAAVSDCRRWGDPGVCSAVINWSPVRGPMIAFAYEGRARIELDAKNYKAAIADFDEAINLDPVRASAFRGRGIAHKQTGELKLAAA